MNGNGNQVRTCELQILDDRSSTGRQRPWKVHRESGELLSYPYEEVNPDKAERLRTCACELTFRQTDEGLKLDGAWFCRVRLCPMCAWRRSLKVAAQMHAIMDAIKTDRPRQRYIMLTLTQKNCLPEELNDEITRVLKGFDRLTKRKAFKNAVKGFYRSMEITRNDDDTYHPHIHAVLAVDSSYFQRSYLTQAAWTDLWRDCLKLNYDPIVHVQIVRGNTATAVAEVAKYSVKSADYIIPDHWDLTVDTIRILDPALHKRRLVAFGGIFKEYHRKLKLDDAEDGDLIRTDPDEKPPDPQDRRICFIWYSGFRNYIKS